MLERIYPLHDQAIHWDSVPLSRHKVILVTGPQRSGTTWAACVLALHYGFALFDERHPLTAGAAFASQLKSDTMRRTSRDAMRMRPLTYMYCVPHILSAHTFSLPSA